MLEVTPSGPVIIEGHTRAYYMSQMRHECFRAVVVSGVDQPLPVTPLPFSEMRVADSTMTAATMLPNKQHHLMRWIEAALHP